MSHDNKKEKISYGRHTILQTDDLVPEMPRVHKFLNFWYENIDAVISEIKVMDGDENSLLPVKETYTLQ